MMKKLSQFLAMAAMVSFSMSACVEEETSAVDVTGTGTIKGIVFANSDATEPGNERAAGATVRISYDASDLSVVSDGDARIVVLETTTDGSGKYSFEVPTTAEGVGFTLTVDDMEGAYKYDDGGEVKTIDAVYFFDDAFTSVRIGETRIRDLYYDYLTTYE